MRRSGGGLEAGPIPLHRPFSQVGGLGMDPDSRRPEPDWAREAESSSGPSIRQMDQAFRRDSRRYDGGFSSIERAVRPAATEGGMQNGPVTHALQELHLAPQPQGVLHRL